MPFAARHRDDITSPLTALPELTVERVEDDAMMAALQVRIESEIARRFSAGAGIRKAGFIALAELSFDADGRAALKELAPGGARVASQVLGVPEAMQELAPCWRCVRAGRGNLSCKSGQCQCDYQRPETGCVA